MRTMDFSTIRKYALATVALAVLAAPLPVWAKSQATSADADKVIVPWSDSSDEANESASNETAPPDFASAREAKGARGNTNAPVSLSQLKVPAADLQPSITDSVSSNDALSNYGPSSGTVVGNRGLELRDEVLRLRSSVNLSASEFALQRASGASGAVEYHSTVAAITARLQNGTTRGNPILLRQWDEAEASLNEVTHSLERLNTLQTSVAADASLSSYLLESVQAAFQLSGAVDEDHDQLKLLRDEISRLIVQLDYLRTQVADDIQRQTNYLTAERSNLQALAFSINRGELLGSGIANREVIVTQPPVAIMPSSSSAPVNGYEPAVSSAPAAPVSSGKLPPVAAPSRAAMEQLEAPASALPTGDVGVAPTAGRLLVLIRYNKPVVDYEQQLSHAVSTALQREPNAEFSVIAVTPVHGDPSDLATAQEMVNRNAESVKASLVQLGLAPARISMGSTQTEDAKTAEVHVYVR